MQIIDQKLISLPAIAFWRHNLESNISAFLERVEHKISLYKLGTFCFSLFGVFLKPKFYRGFFSTYRLDFLNDCRTLCHSSDGLSHREKGIFRSFSQRQAYVLERNPYCPCKDGLVSKLKHSLRRLVFSRPSNSNDFHLVDNISYSKIISGGRLLCNMS